MVGGTSATDKGGNTLHLRFRQNGLLHICQLFAECAKRDGLIALQMPHQQARIFHREEAFGHKNKQRHNQCQRKGQAQQHQLVMPQRHIQ